MPPTLISQDVNQIKKFIKQYNESIIKPLYEKGGKGIFKISLKDKNIDKKLITVVKKEKTSFNSSKIFTRGKIWR